MKNRYVGRTFIQPTQAMREVAVKIKLNANVRFLKGSEWYGGRLHCAGNHQPS